MKIERKESGGNWREAEERVVRKARKLGKTRKGRVYREGRVRRERGNIVAVICRTVSKQEESTNLAPFFPLCLSRPEQNESEVNPPRCKTHRPGHYDGVLLASGRNTCVRLCRVNFENGRNQCPYDHGSRLTVRAEPA